MQIRCVGKFSGNSHRRSRARVTRCKHWNFLCSGTQGRLVNQSHGRFSDERRGRERAPTRPICDDDLWD